MADDDTGVLGELLVRAARAQRGRWREVLAPWELSPSQARALRVLTGHEGTRVSELAEALHIAPRSATEVADSLEERGLVERTPDPSDRRAVLLRPTEAGRKLRAEVEEARMAGMRAMFARLPTEDRAELARILRHLVES
jgi:DNA-binding MarR family transcriptional regulator